MVGGVYSEWLLLSILSASAGFSSVMPISELNGYAGTDIHYFPSATVPTVT